MSKPKIFTTLFGLLGMVLVVAAGLTYSWYSARAQASSGKLLAGVGGMPLGIHSDMPGSPYSLKSTVETYTGSDAECNRPIALTPGEYQEPPFGMASERSSGPYVRYPSDDNEVSVISCSVENNSSANIIARINLKGAPWESEKYETAAFPADSRPLYPCIAFYKLRGPLMNDISGERRHVSSNPENTGVHIKSFMGIGKYNADKTKIDFCYKPAFKKMAECEEGDDYLYAYMPIDSVVYIAYALFPDGSVSRESNPFQYAVYTFPITAHDNESPLLTALGAQTHEAAVDSFFGIGTYAALRSAIIPPSQSLSDAR